MKPALSTILVVEDDEKTAASIQDGLRDAGFCAVVARNGEEGLRELASAHCDLVVLDWMLPGLDGIGVVRAIRQQGARIPVLLVTARDDVADRVHGLDAGADDYLVKPFAFAELLARVRALLRRAESGNEVEHRVEDLVVHLGSRRVFRSDRELTLTPREFDVLVYLLRHERQIVTRRMLARDVWREPRRATSLDNAIDVHVGHLRRKLDEHGGARLIHTVRGVGFVLRAEEAG